jgi:hypothetical protein
MRVCYGNVFTDPLPSSGYTRQSIVVIYVCDYRRGMDWIFDLLTARIHRWDRRFTVSGEYVRNI